MINHREVRHEPCGQLPEAHPDKMLQIKKFLAWIPSHKLSPTEPNNGSQNDSTVLHSRQKWLEIRLDPASCRGVVHLGRRVLHVGPLAPAQAVHQALSSTNNSHLTSTIMDIKGTVQRDLNSIFLHI